MVECAAADPDREAANTNLAAWMETLAFTAPYAEEAAPLVQGFEILRRIDPVLAPLLGRAIYAAKLAEARTAAGGRVT
jgi:hypothetical protein